MLSYVLCRPSGVRCRADTGSSPAVVETERFAIRGWAACLGAWNLVTDDPDSPATYRDAKSIERLKFYGNNGFGDPFGKKQAQSIISGRTLLSTTKKASDPGLELSGGGWI